MTALYVVTKSYEYEGEDVIAAFDDLESALQCADRVEYGDHVLVTRCAPEASGVWKRQGCAPEDAPDVFSYEIWQEGKLVTRVDRRRSK